MVFFLSVYWTKCLWNIYFGLGFVVIEDIRWEIELFHIF